MVDEILLKLARYPFLREAKEYVRREAPSIQELLVDPIYERARSIGVERVDNAFEKGDVGNRSLVTNGDCLMELFSYPIARMITICIDDSYLKRRYALGEAVHMYRNLIREKPSFILDLSKEFNLDARYIDEKLSIYFTDYLRYAPTRYRKWKMINREMIQGYITISSRDLARILQEALRERINQELDTMSCNEYVNQIFSSDIYRIKSKVRKLRRKIEETPIGKLEVEYLPPCIKNILDAIQSGENVPHIGRFALVSFLNGLKLSRDEIIAVFSRAPDFEEEKTRYQIEHITGVSSSTKYTPPGCDKMRTYGLCPLEERVNLCKEISHPLSYYKIKWKRRK
ncbi:MAG TPA: DNA primase regulatory subunit PriL [Thermoplasmatales archaeon]|nr:DNA primase regulatory subunit PriL [Thermoplasmatales archaeon]